jgi:hypothetical protein
MSQAIQLVLPWSVRPQFFVGLHQPSDAPHFARCLISVNRLRTRTSRFGAQCWILDSGAFTELSTHGHYRHGVAEYGEQVRRWAEDPTLVAAVAQDYMCEPFIIAKTGLSIAEHQDRTIERYDQLLTIAPDAPLMPVIQGYAPEDYAHHTATYGRRIAPAAWVGVGSICKRNGTPEAIVAVLTAIKEVRPDLRLHGFGIKLTALRDDRVRALLASADSAAWSYAARREGRNANDWREAAAYVSRVNEISTGEEAS